jgi:20S proteasome alpha/beta subunit
MTLIVGLEGQDGMVLASDSRGTIGDPRSLTAVNDTHKKIFKLSDYCGIATSGATELCNRFIDSFKKIVESKDLVNVDDIVQELYEWGRKEFRQWFGAMQFVQPRGQQIIDHRPNIVLIVVGYNKNTDGANRIYLFTSAMDFVPQLCTSGHMLGGVPQYAIYLMHRLYNPQMKLINIKRLASYLIRETATQDPKVGGPVRMAEITLDKGFQELTEEEINKINKENDEQNNKLREFFFKE